MVAKPFTPVAHGIREVHIYTREVKSKVDRAILSQEDLASFYASEPFRVCAECAAPGFLWLPAFTARGHDFRLVLVTLKDGRRITPRPLCLRCFDNLDASPVDFRGFSHPAP